MNLTPSQYCIDFTDTDTDQGDAFYNDLSAIADSVFDLALNNQPLPASPFTVADKHLAEVVDADRLIAESMPIPPSVCTGCGDTFTMTYYRPGTAERVWSCGTPSCDCFKGMSL